MTRDPHDHPWSFKGIVLKGGYIDERWYWAKYRCYPPTEKKGIRTGPIHEEVRPGSVIWRDAEHIHRVILPFGQTAWTLIFTKGYKRDWNFITEDGPVLWRKYLGIPDGVDVGE
jgi:hypothetical protein